MSDSSEREKKRRRARKRSGGTSAPSQFRKPRTGHGRRTPISNVRGREERRGDEVLSAKLSLAFKVQTSDTDLPVQGVHGIHPYPARLHPAWVRGIIEMIDPGALVLDPFCGSGTTLVEASLAGHRSFGSDLNAIALRIARHRTSRKSQVFLESYARAAARIHDEAAHRRDTPFGALAKGERRYPPHVLTQLINLRAAIETERHSELREALLLTMSPLLTKFASRKGRPAPNVNRRAIRDHFLRRAELTTDSWADYAETLPQSLPDPDVELADAREQPWPSHRADVVITSPPYPGVYDYVAEQDHRQRWIGGEAAWMTSARKKEIGSRGGSPQDWSKGMYEVLRELTRVTCPGGWIFLVVGDGANGGRALRADRLLRDILHGKDLHLRRLAMVSQDRPNFHGPSAAAFKERPRREHLLLLERP